MCLLSHAKIKDEPYLKRGPMRDIGNTVYVNSRISVDTVGSRKPIWMLLMLEIIIKTIDTENFGTYSPTCIQWTDKSIGTMRVY